MKSPGKQQAYTLIEILITLLIFAIISTIVVMVLQNILQVREQVQQSAEHLAQLQKAVTIVSRDVEQIIDQRIRNETGRTEPAVWSQSDDPLKALMFTRAGFVNPAAAHDRGTLQRVRYRLEKQQLIREYWTTLNRTEVVEPSRLTLLEQVDTLSWRYIDNRNNSYDFWPPTGRLSGPPAAIEMTLSLANGHGSIVRFMRIPGGQIEN